MRFHLNSYYSTLGLWFIVIFSGALYAQNEPVAQKVFLNGMEKPNLVSTHPIGLLLSRFDPTFKLRAASNVQLSFQVQSGNVFHPPVEVYLPEDPEIRQRFSQQDWFFRTFEYSDQRSTPADLMRIHFDAVYKVYRFDVQFPMHPSHEFSIGARAFQTVAGNFINAPFTNDETIEAFHSNIAGGKDPFGREFYGVNQVVVDYIDRRGSRLQMSENDVLFGGLELRYVYHPEIFRKEDKSWFANFQANMGLNTNKYNRSIDLAMGTSVVKSFKMPSRQGLLAGLGVTATRKNITSASGQLDTGNNQYLGIAETMLQWSHRTNSGHLNMLAVNYQLQTPLFKRAEKDYFHLKGDWQSINQGWHHGYTTLIENLTAWSIIYTHKRSDWSISLYLREDLAVHNAPDVETGISFDINVFKSKS